MIADADTAATRAECVRGVVQIVEALVDMLTLICLTSPTVSRASVDFIAAMERLRYHACAPATSGESVAFSASRAAASPVHSRSGRCATRPVGRTNAARDVSGGRANVASVRPWPMTSTVATDVDTRDAL